MKYLIKILAGLAFMLHLSAVYAECVPPSAVVSTACEETDTDTENVPQVNFNGENSGTLTLIVIGAVVALYIVYELSDGEAPIFNYDLLPQNRAESKTMTAPPQINSSGNRINEVIFGRHRW